MIGKVTVWNMTEEQRLAYISKHPIVPTEQPSGPVFKKNEEKRKKSSENGAKSTKEMLQKKIRIGGHYEGNQISTISS